MQTNNTYYDGIDRFIVITVATEENENLTNFKKSCEVFGIPYTILGLGDKWESGKAENGVLLEPGGAQKINYLKRELEKIDNLQDHIILFTDSYDVIFAAPPIEIVTKFRNIKKPIVFSAEKTCWPDPEVEFQYPRLNSEYAYLNSGGFIGYGDKIKQLISDEVENWEDDQRYYTKKYLESPESYHLDSEQYIFQTLNLAIDDVEIDKNFGRLKNIVTKTNPCVIHANGPSSVKEFLRNITEVFFNKVEEGNSDMVYEKPRHTISINLMLDIDVNDINQVFDQVKYLTYPKNLIKLNLFYVDNRHDYKIGKFIKTFGDEYLSVNTFNLSLSRGDMRNQAMYESKLQNTDYTLIMDCNYVFRNRKSIEFLIRENKDILTPMIKEENTQWVNFTLMTDKNGFSVNSDKDSQIYSYDLKGCWRIQYGAGIWFISKNIIEKVSNMFTNQNTELDEDFDYDIIFSLNLKNGNIAQYLSNNFYYGGIIP